jgi:hypothetical protein
MRKTLITIVIAAVMLTSVSTFMALRAEGKKLPTASPTWEYRVVVLTDIIDISKAIEDGPSKIGTTIESKFNELGRDGWKYSGDINGAVIFERPKP